MSEIAHTHDPPSSHESAERVERSGRRWANKRLVLNFVATFPGNTAIEIWNSMPVTMKEGLREPQEVRRRLTDLLADGLVRQGEQRKCRIRGTTMVTWWPAEKQGELFRC